MILELNIIKESNILRDRWSSYARKNNYAAGVKFEETINSLEEFIEIIIAAAA